MKLNLALYSLLFFTLISCNSESNSADFIQKTTGRYLYNSNEIIEVYFKESQLYLKWRGATNIKPLKVDEHTFFVKEMNEKIQFSTNPTDHKEYLVLLPKKDSDTIIQNFRKLNENEKIPNEYLLNNQFDKALQGFLAIQQKDSTDNAINEANLNSLGYKKLRNNDVEMAMQIFKINKALYPESSNVYDSLGEAFLKNGDTINAIKNYKKSLTLDSGNKRAKRQIEKLEKLE